MEPLREPAGGLDALLGPVVYFVLAVVAAIGGIAQDRPDHGLQLGLLILSGCLFVASALVRMSRR
jgi:hypothetical protein